MKKLLLSLMVCGLASMASAQNHTVQSFIAATSIQVTNTINVTNLLAQGAATTNFVGVVYTNLNGTRINDAGATTPGYNLLKDAALWPDKNGNYFPNVFTTAGLGATNQVQSPLNLLIRLHGGSGANSAVTFLFSPIWDGDGANATDTYTTSADQWSVAVTANTTTPVVLSTNVPLWKWPGAKYLRLERVSNADTDASSGVFVTKCVLTGFRP